jgi:hypothetical protein
MCSHFGQELHCQHKRFNNLFSEVHKLYNETNTAMFTYLPLRQLFLQDYSDLEKILVIINFVLFGACMFSEDVDQNVGTVIIYFMFAIAYFVTTTTCLSGANQIKTKISKQGQNEQEDESKECSDDSIAERNAKNNSTKISFNAKK